ncbi:MAG: hypothetical protein ACKVRP_12690 [Bacteroidota bacterium]
MKRHLLSTELELTILLFLLIIPLCGCSSTYPVRYTTTGQLNKELTGGSVTIEPREGKEIFAKQVKIYGDSASWGDARIGQEFKVSMEKLKRIVIIKKDHVLGAVEWLFLGGLGGAGVGWLSTSGESEGYRKEMGAVAVFGYGVIGAGIGLITGAIVGHREYYEFQVTEGNDSRGKTQIEKNSAKTDTLYMKNGDIVRGTIITEVGDQEDLRSVTIRTADGETLTYYGSYVDRIGRGD